MSALPELQSRVIDALFGRGEAGDLVRANGLAGTRRLQVYRNNVEATLSEALAAVYPVTRRLVGEGFFGWTAHGYLQRHASTSGNVQDYGAHYADRLAALPQAAGLPYLADVARLEWAWHEVWHARAAPPLDPGDLAALPSAQVPELGFALQPAARLLASPWPILRIWLANQPEHATPEPIDLGDGGCRLLVIQRALDVEIEPLSAGDLALLTLLDAGATLAEALAAALDAEPAFDLQPRLARHIGAGTLTGLRLPV
jgi:hypothetical protein